MIVFKVFNVLSSPKPSFISFFILLLRVNTGHHTIIKQRVRLSHIHNINLDIRVFRWIVNPKIKPLSVSFSVKIILKKEVKFISAYLKNRK